MHTINNKKLFVDGKISWIYQKAFEWESKLGKLYFTNNLRALDNNIVSFDGFKRKLTETESIFLGHMIGLDPHTKILSNKNLFILTTFMIMTTNSEVKLCIMQIIDDVVKIYTKFICRDKIKNLFGGLTVSDIESWSIHPTEPIFIIKNKLLSLQCVDDENTVKIIELFDLSSLKPSMLSENKYIVRTFMTERKIILCVKHLDKYTIYYTSNPYFCNIMKSEKEIFAKKLNNITFLDGDTKLLTSKYYKDLFFVSYVDEKEIFLDIYLDNVSEMTHLKNIKIVKSDKLINNCINENRELTLFRAMSLDISRRIHIRHYGQDFIYEIPIVKKPSWETVRLLWIGKLKCSTADIQECYISKLPHDIIRYLTQFLIDWSCVDNKNESNSNGTENIRYKRDDYIMNNFIYKAVKNNTK